MQVGSLVECIGNRVDNPLWRGIPPVIGEYYTIRQTEFSYLMGREKSHFCLVEEIISPMSNTGGEYLHTKAWYREIQPPMKEVIEELMKETQLEPV